MISTTLIKLASTGEIAKAQRQTSPVRTCPVEHRARALTVRGRRPTTDDRRPTHVITDRRRRHRRPESQMQKSKCSADELIPAVNSERPLALQKQEPGSGGGCVSAGLRGGSLTLVPIVRGRDQPARGRLRFRLRWPGARRRNSDSSRPADRRGAIAFARSSHAVSLGRVIAVVAKHKPPADPIDCV